MQTRSAVIRLLVLFAETLQLRCYRERFHVFSCHWRVAKCLVLLGRGSTSNQCCLDLYTETPCRTWVYRHNCIRNSLSCHGLVVHRGNQMLTGQAQIVPNCRSHTCQHSTGKPWTSDEVTNCVHTARCFRIVHVKRRGRRIGYMVVKHTTRRVLHCGSLILWPLV